MRKITLLSTVAVMMLGWGSIPSASASALKFREVKTRDVSLDIPEPKPNYSSPLTKAEALHSVLYDLNSYRQKALDKQEEEKLRDTQKQTLEAARLCNIKKLEKQFKNPTAVWDKMVQTYHDKEKDLSIYLNSANPAPKTQEEQQQTDQQIMAESFMFWKLGEDILTDVYANQDAWGERKSTTTPSFPIWEDQKYVYDQAWDKKYTQINAFFGVPPMGRPLIKNEAKYDYARHDDVVAAHTAYLTALAATNPQKALLLPDSLRKPPEPAPRPLPPKKEAVIYREASDGSIQVYPEWPAPWQEFANSGFSSYNPKGEMAEDFIGKSLMLKESAKGHQPTNRLDTYQRLEQRVATTEKNIGARDDMMQTITKLLNDRLEPYGINASVDLADDEQYNQLRKEIFETRQFFINQAEEALKTTEEQRSPLAKDVLKRQQEYNQRQAAGLIKPDPNDKNPLNISWEESYALHEDLQLMSHRQEAQTMLDALKKDQKGQASLSRKNAANVDQMIKETEALRSLEAEMKKLQGQYKISEPVLDEDCLDNGGIY